MDFIKSWVQNIAMIIIFSTFLELVIPQDNFKKYIQMIMGLMIIFSIIQPISQLTKGSINFSMEVLNHEIDIEKKGIQNQKVWLSKNQEEQTLSIFKNKLKLQMQEIIKKEKGVKEAKVEIDIEEDSEKANFATIKKVEIFLVENSDNGKYESKNEEESKGIRSIERINVETININSKKENEKQKSSLEDSILIKNIKNSLSYFYNLSPNNINIIVQKN